MEMEYFVPPAEAQQWYEYWCAERMDWYQTSACPTTSCASGPTTPTS